MSEWTDGEIIRLILDLKFGMQDTGKERSEKYRGRAKQYGINEYGYRYTEIDELLGRLIALHKNNIAKDLYTDSPNTKS